MRPILRATALLALLCAAGVNGQTTGTATDAVATTTEAVAPTTEIVATTVTEDAAATTEAATTEAATTTAVEATGTTTEVVESTTDATATATETGDATTTEGPLNTNGWTSRIWCQRGEDCWPTQEDVDALIAKMQPNSTRTLAWIPGQMPPPCAVPLNSPGEQPLYGAGVEGLKPVYVESEEEAKAGPCFEGPDGSMMIENATEACKVAVRSMPQEGWKPSYTLWPENREQVQEAVKFATKHNLCIMVTGPGHDLLNRHSCNDGVQIRTSLMKKITWDLTDEKGYGWEDGNVRFGPGVTWSEVQKSAAENGRFISSGWCPTVGIIGWSLGAGHGPFVPGKGNGGDNILSLDIITADGKAITANEKENSDLYWAMRGGGGSTWGVVTGITVRAHKIPEGGFTTLGGSVQAPLCENGVPMVNAAIDDFYVPFTLSRNAKWGGYIDFLPQILDPVTAAVANCTAGVQMTVTYVYQGPAEDQEFKDAVEFVKKGGIAEPEVANYATWYDKINETLQEPGGSGVILPTPFSVPGPTNVGGVPSVLLSREIVENGTFSDWLKTMLKKCLDEQYCVLQSLASDITGFIDSPQPEDRPFSQGYRTALVHVKNDYDSVDMQRGAYTPETIKELLYPLGPNSYFGESAYIMENWPERYYGMDNYKRLLEVKNKFDPDRVFGCHHCVGDDESSSL